MTRETAFGHLRPTTIPEMLDRTYAVTARFWYVLWGCGVIYGSDHLLALVLGQRPGIDNNDPAQVASGLAVALVGYFAAAVAQLAVFQGLIFPLRPISAKALLRTGIRKFPAYFLTHLGYLFLMFLSGIIAWAFLRVGLSKTGHPGQLISGAVVVLAGAWMALRLCLAPVACLIEDGAPWSAFRRSWHLTSSWPGGWRIKKDRPLLRLLAVSLLPVLVSLGLAAFTLVLGHLVLHIPLPGPGRAPATASMMEIVAFLGNALAMPLYWAGLMGLYVEYRMRHEALDFYLRIRDVSQDLPEKYPVKSS